MNISLVGNSNGAVLYAPEATKNPGGRAVLGGYGAPPVWEVALMELMRPGRRGGTAVIIAGAVRQFCRK